MSGTTVQRCDCTHKYQDKRYGKQKRVMNVSVDTSKVRCTVCEKEHTKRGK